MRKPSILRRVLRGWALLIAVSLALPAQAAALTVYSASIKNSYCSGSYSWKGDLPNDNAWDTQYYQTTGTVSYCFYVYRVSDSDPNGDYYVVAERVNWNTTYDGATRGDNAASITLSSSIAAKDGVYEGAPESTVAYSGNCSSSVSFSVSAGIFSVSVSEAFCGSGRLNVTSLSSTTAKWGSPDVTRTPKWEVAYMLKVPNGAKPRLTATVAIPRYSIWRDSTTLYWKYTKVYTNVTRSYTIP